MKKWTLVSSIAALCLLPQCKTPSPEQMTTKQRSTAAYPVTTPRGKIDFARHVRPILEIRCLECHNKKRAAQYPYFNMQTKEGAFTTGVHAPVILPGKPDDSYFIKVLAFDYDHPKSMPPAPDKIWGASLDILKKWIAQGADWPENTNLVPPQEWDS